MGIRACIFDLDGVIVDTAKYHYLAWKEIAEKLNIPFTENDNERLKGVSRMDSLEIILELGGVYLSEDEKEKYASEKNEQYRNYILKMTPDELLPGVEDFLNELKRLNIATAIGSSSKNAITILEKIDLMRYFDVVMDGTKVTRAKPHPELYLLCARSLKIPPSDCVVFEDAVAGIEAAHFAGMKCVGVGSSSVLSEADMVIPGFTNLKAGNLLF